MTTELTPLEAQIVSILQNAASEEGLPLPELVQRLKDAGFPSSNTTQVRSAVWQLIHKRKVDFTPHRLVTAVAS